MASILGWILVVEGIGEALEAGVRVCRKDSRLHTPPYEPAAILPSSHTYTRTHAHLSLLYHTLP